MPPLVSSVAVATAEALPVALVSLVMALAVAVPLDDAPKAVADSGQVAAAVPGDPMVPLVRNLRLPLDPMRAVTASVAALRAATLWVTAMLIPLKIAKPSECANTAGPLTNQQSRCFMATAHLTAQRLRELLYYEPATGAFSYRVKRGICNPGDPAGSQMVRGNHGIGIDYKRYAAHRLAWLYMTGHWPAKEIDHVDGNPMNNAWVNLREADSAQNKQNRHRPRSDNMSGLLGAMAHTPDANGRPRWRARIQLDGKQIHLGLFFSPEEAHSAYVEAKRRLHPFGVL